MLSIDSSVFKNMISDVEPHDEERCGFFFGMVKGQHRIITKSMSVVNSEEGDKCYNFKITSRDYLQAENVAEQNQLALFGIYHSHPNHSAIPSAFDRTAALPNFSYIIISVINRRFNAIRSWQLNDHALLKEEKIKILEGPFIKQL